MQAAQKEKDYNILVDEETKVECDQKLSFKLIKEDMVKG
jgi:hypothetical protein